MAQDALLELAARRYRFDPATLFFISDTTNRIYGFEREGKGYILRLSRRPPACVGPARAEMDWLYYLATNGLSVSLPLAADDGGLVISADIEGEHYIASAFERAGGVLWDWDNRKSWGEALFVRWGRVMGDMHRLTKRYAPPGADRRAAFDGTNALLESVRACPEIDALAREIVGEIMRLPKDADSYGLIHYDLHPYNFLIEDDRLNVFDFDDSLYGWLAMDIGVALYHGLWWGLPQEEGERAGFAATLVRNFLEGYLSANRLSDLWLKRIPLFMRFRQACAFSWFFDPDDINGAQQAKIRDMEQGFIVPGYRLDESLFGA